MASPPVMEAEFAPSPSKTAQVSDRDVVVLEPKATPLAPGWLHDAWVKVFEFIIMHYNLYPFAVTLLLLYMMLCGHAWMAVVAILLYLPSFFDGAEYSPDRRNWDGLRQAPIWLPLMERLHLTVVREAPLDSAKQYIFGYHPHGIIVMSRFAVCSKVFETLFPGVSYRALGATTVFRVPLARELCLWMGGVDASRTTANHVLEAGKSITVYPGGIREMFTVDPESKDNVIILKSRFGFVKLAIRHGADLVPTMIFNEKRMYKILKPPAGIHAFLQKLAPFPMVLFYGRFLWMPLDLPKDKPFGVVYGKPIEITRNENPTDEEVRAVHAKYMAEVERLFEQYKRRFGYDEDEKLIIT